jgi:Protein of unknown function (DUF3152)
MKCPKCNAELLPVEDEMFCLQCGTVVDKVASSDDKGPNLEDTSDPLLQKAITDITHKPVMFKSAVGAQAVTAFQSLGNVIVAKPAMPGPGGAAVMMPPVKPAVPAAPAPLKPVNPVAKPVGVLPVPKPAEKLEPVKSAKVDKPKTNGSSIAVWMAGILSFVLFLGINGAAYAYFSNHLMPGVMIGQTYVGGTSFSDLHHELMIKNTVPTLAAEVGPTKFMLNTSAADAEWYAEVENAAEQIGRSNPLPIAGVIGSFFTKPIRANTLSDQEAVDLARGIAASVDHASSSATPLIVGDQAFVVTDKSGQQLDISKAAAELGSAFGTQSNVQLTTDQIKAATLASGYTNDISLAQTIMTLKLALIDGAQTLTPTPAQIGSWLVFNGPGKGVSVSSQGVDNYVASIPGKFDRQAAANALYQAVNNHQALKYSLSPKPTSVTAQNIAIVPHLYTYCLAANAVDQLAFRKQVSQTLSDPAGWALGGRLSYLNASSNCNFTINLLTAGQMTGMDPGCKDHTTCSTYNEIGISESAWQTAPKSWTQGLVAYRTGLINQEVGHWLGFTHAACTDGAASQQILTQPTVVLDGCSPNWNEIPAESQNTKILPGF